MGHTNLGPLRKFVSDLWKDGYIFEALECGHLIPRQFDKFGRLTRAKKRRCKQCRTNEPEPSATAELKR